MKLGTPFIPPRITQVICSHTLSAYQAADRAPTMSPAQDAMSKTHMPRFTMSLDM